MPRKARTQPLIPSQKPRPFDLASRYAADTVVVRVMDPVTPLGAPEVDTGLRVRIRSIYSDEARKAAQAARELVKTLPDGSVDPNGPGMTESVMEQTIAITVEWWDENA